jgi:hypothetical protein
MGAAAVRGFQGRRPHEARQHRGLCQALRRLRRLGERQGLQHTNIPENELRNVHLPPFKAAMDAGCATVMTSFSDIDGIPATANSFLLRQVLREEWGFDGVGGQRLGVDSPARRAWPHGRRPRVGARGGVGRCGHRDGQHHVRRASGVPD